MPSRSVEKAFSLTEKQRSSCLLDSKDCVFPFTKNEAIEIATSKGFDRGVEPWEVNIDWISDYGYVWVMRNTLSAKGQRREGKIMYLNAYTGNVDSISDWSGIYDIRLR